MAENILDVRLKQRYDTEANWTSINPVLLAGELAISSDKDGKYKVGNGSSKWSELSYAYQSGLDAKQNTITGGATTITSSNLTANRALISNGSGKVAVSAVTSTELGYLDGVTSGIQAQLDSKAPLGHTHNYAGSSSVGGAAISANKLNTNAGDSNTPVYFSGGIPVACTSLDLNTTGNAATATKATKDSAGQQINTTYIKSITADGKDLTYIKGNGTTATINTQQNFITLTKAEYDALVSAGTVDEDSYYFITDDANTSPMLIQYITFAASGWTASDDDTYYTQSVTASQITADDEPMVIKSLAYSTGATEAKAYNKAFGILCSGVGETSDGTVTWKCYKKPATDITVGLIKVLA